MAGVHVRLPSDKLLAGQGPSCLQDKGHLLEEGLSHGYRQGLETRAAGGQLPHSHSSTHLPSVRKQLLLQVWAGQALHFLPKILSPLSK